jgi:hypothetical protein
MLMEHRHYATDGIILNTDFSIQVLQFATLPSETQITHLTRKILKPSPLTPLPDEEGKRSLAGAAPLRPLCINPNTG